MKEIQKFFNENAERNEVFQTSDGLLFSLQCDAENHAASLENKAVKAFKRTNTSQKNKAMNNEAEDVIADDSMSAELESEDTATKPKKKK